MPDLLEHTTQRPVRLDAHVVGGHQAPDALGRVAEDGLGLPAVSGIERGQETACHLRRQLLDERGPVVGVHGLDDGRRGGPQLLDQLLLAIVLDLGKGVARLLAGQEPEGEGCLLRLEQRQRVRDVGRRHVAQRRPNLPELSFTQLLLDLLLQQLGGVVHSSVLNPRLAAAVGCQARLSGRARMRGHSGHHVRSGEGALAV